jgi:hypothetical protein
MGTLRYPFCTWSLSVSAVYCLAAQDECKGDEGALIDFVCDVVMDAHNAWDAVSASLQP